MSSTSAATSQATQRARRSGAAGRQRVGEYVGEPAGQAAQAVRRAGLRPGLDRSFGCAPELLGRIVAQEPPAGGELPRNGLVTLYVAAPGAAPEDTSAASAASLEPTAFETDAPQPQQRAHRRRKRGLASSEPSAFPTPPPPSLPSDRLPRAARAASPEDEITVELDAPADLVAADAGKVDAEPEEDVGNGGLSDEQFVIHADDVFAGRAEPAWRRVYRHRDGTWPRVDGLRSRFADRPPLVKAAVLLVVAWIVVALAVALTGAPAGRHRANVVSALVGRTVGRGQPAPRRVPVLRSPRPDRASARAKADVGARRRPAPRPSSSVVSRGGATPERVSAPVAVPAQSAAPAATGQSPAEAQAPAPASTPPAPAQQTGGGPFSP